MKTNKINMKIVTENQLITSGALGLNVVAIIALLNIQDIDIPLFIAIYCISISSPLLGGAILKLHHEKHFIQTIHTFWDAILGAGGLLISFLGIIAIFFHFSPIISLVFLITSIFAMFAFKRSTNLLEKANIDINNQ